MKKQRLVAMTESAVMAALSLILNFIIVFKMPQGGSITLGAMVPIMIVALRRGAGWGILAGVLSGLLQFITTGQAAHPLSILLDYLLAYGVLGITGFFKGSLPKIALGMTLTIFLRCMPPVKRGNHFRLPCAGGAEPVAVFHGLQRFLYDFRVDYYNGDNGIALQIRQKIVRRKITGFILAESKQSSWN